MAINVNRRRLTPREDKFISYVLKGENATEAAKLAGYAEGSAHVAAWRALQRPPVLEALRSGAEKQIVAGVAVGASTLLFLARKAASEDVRYKAACALLDRGGLPLIRTTEHRHVISDTRSDAELIEHVRGLAKELGVPLDSRLIEAQPVEVESVPDQVGKSTDKVPEMSKALK